MKSKLEINQYDTKRWKLPNGHLHREDVPAIEYSDGYKRWFLKNKEYTEEQYKKKMRLDKLDKILLNINFL